MKEAPDPACPIPEEWSLTLAQRLEAARRRSRERAEHNVAKGRDGAAPLPPTRRTGSQKATKPRIHATLTRQSRNQTGPRVYGCR